MDRPNVLLLLEDQLRYDVVEREELCHTPTLDVSERTPDAVFTRYAMGTSDRLPGSPFLCMRSIRSRRRSFRPEWC
ncbi:MAG: hypothetical protein ACRDHO_11535 [Actinomycetota bacterium]